MSKWLSSFEKPTGLSSFEDVYYFFPEGSVFFKACKTEMSQKQITGREMNRGIDVKMVTKTQGYITIKHPKQMINNQIVTAITFLIMAYFLLVM